jgi:hypothetical protein
MTKIQDQNCSTALQIWVIGALLPTAFYFIGNSEERDFYIMWEAATVVLQGGWSFFPYPPHAIFFFLPFGLLPNFVAFVAWNFASMAFFYWAARPYMPPGWSPIFAVLTPASLICLDFGQTGLLLGALWLLAFRGKWTAVAILTFKPHLGFLSILSFRSGVDFIRVALLVLVLIAASALFFGSALWLSYVDQVQRHGAQIGSVKRWLFAGVSPAIAYGFWGWIPFATAGALLLARKVNVFTTSTASFLISPYGFNYDMTVASLGFGLAIALHWHAMPIRDRVAMALGFLSPVIAVFGAWWVPPVLIWALWAQTRYDFEGLGADHAGWWRQSLTS